MLSHNFMPLVITFAVALTWLPLNDFATHRDWISSHLSRKIIHMGTGPIIEGTMGSGFKIDNPNAVAACGCGNSSEAKDGSGTPNSCPSCH